ncbi:MAG: hypothetical protein R3C56_03850 [Pirellulaceae bacterium]
MGPDALAISLPEFSQRLAATQRAVKVALLDQKLVAGVGNLYASEMLHVARIHPQLPPRGSVARKSPRCMQPCKPFCSMPSRTKVPH